MNFGECAPHPTGNPLGFFSIHEYSHIHMITPSIQKYSQKSSGFGVSSSLWDDEANPLIPQFRELKGNPNIPSFCHECGAAVELLKLEFLPPKKQWDCFPFSVKWE